MNFRPYWLIFVLLFIGGPLLLAQTEKKAKEKKEKEYVIIRKEKGDKDIKQLEIKDKDANIFIHGDKIIELKGNGVIIDKKMDVDGEMFFFNSDTGDFNINVTGEDGKKHIIIEFKNDNGEQQHLEWEGEGEVPAHIQKYLHQPQHPLHVEWVSVDDQLHEDHAFLGVSAAEKEINTIDGEEMMIHTGENRTPGVLIDHVVPESAAEEAGLAGEDIILTIDGQAIDSFNDLKKIMEQHKAGDEINIQYLRGEETRTTSAILKAGQKTAVFEWRDEDNDLTAPLDQEGVFMFRSGDHFNKDHNVIIIRKIDDGEKAAEVEEVLPDLELERTLELKDFQAFPNPSSGQVQLNFKANQAPTTIRVTSVQGQQVFREYMRDFDGIYNQSLDFNDLPGGVYVLSVEQEGKVYAEQLIIR